MGYWVLIIFIFILLTVLVGMAWHSFINKKDMEEFRLGLLAIIPVMIFSIYFGIDIPSALGGGQALYVDKRPEVLPMMSLHMVYADGQRFIDFGGYNTDKYEQDARYCITYTKFTKTVLKIEKVE